MDILTKLEILRRLIEQGTKALPWFGNLAIQKVIYLLQSVYDDNLGYTFGLHQLGPYSPDLAEAVQLGEQIKLWQSWEEESGSGYRGKRFKVLKPQLPDKSIEAADRQWAIAKDKIDRALGQLSTFHSRELELVATIHYLRHVQEVPEPKLSEVLRVLKPKFTVADVEWGKLELQKLEQSAAQVNVIAA